MKIKITQEDIDKGIKDSCWQCPIALAFARRFNIDKNNLYVWQDGVDVYFSDDTHHFYKHTPASKLFMNSFDKYVTVEPIELTFRKARS